MAAQVSHSPDALSVVEGQWGSARFMQYLLFDYEEAAGVLWVVFFWSFLFVCFEEGSRKHEQMK